MWVPPLNLMCLARDKYKTIEADHLLKNTLLVKWLSCFTYIARKRIQRHKSSSISPTSNRLQVTAAVCNIELHLSHAIRRVRVSTIIWAISVESGLVARPEVLKKKYNWLKR